MSEEQKPVETAALETKAPVLMMQTVVITLADGRKGIFAGPELITKTEMLLQCVPRIVHVDFLPSREFGKAPEIKEEAKLNADQESKEPVAEQPGTDVEQKA